jgi:lyso-ornithine lipid O-acyltransferase
MVGMEATAELALPAPARFDTRPLGRAARVGAFALETWSRLTFGAQTTRAACARELSWVAENACALHGVRLRVEGRIPSAASVLVANHISYFDPLVIASLVRCAPVAKREVSGWPLVGELSRRLGVLWVDRACPVSGARVIREAVSTLAEDVSVLVFPEGTTTYGSSVLPFKRGIFGAARLAGVPIVPIAISYEGEEAAWVGDDAFLPHYARSIARPCTRVRVRFMEPLTADVAAEKLAEMARVRIETSLPNGYPRVHDESNRRAVA